MKQSLYFWFVCSRGVDSRRFARTGLTFNPYIREMSVVLCGHQNLSRIAGLVAGQVIWNLVVANVDAWPIGAIFVSRYESLVERIKNVVMPRPPVDNILKMIQTESDCIAYQVVHLCCSTRFSRSWNI